jgi:hypothetical protein
MEDTDNLEERKEILYELIKQIDNPVAIQRLTVIISDYLKKKAIS